MKLLTHLELEKPTGHAMAPHNTEKGKWDGADPTPQHKAQEERFYFSCWTSIRKHKASLNKVISLFAKHTCKKCNQKCWALPLQSLDQTQSCHQSQFPAFCSQFAQANSANSTNSSTKTSSTILYFSFFIPNFQLFCTVQVKHVKPGFAIGWKLKKEEQVKNKIHKTLKREPDIRSSSRVQSIISVCTHQHRSCTALRKALLRAYSPLPLIPSINLWGAECYKSQHAGQMKTPKCTARDELPSGGNLSEGNHWTQVGLGSACGAKG